FDSLVRNVDSSSKFYMYPRFIQLIIPAQVVDLSSHTTRYIFSALTQKVFANMRRVGKEEIADDVSQPTLPLPSSPVIVPAAPTVSTRKRKGVVIRDPEEELHDDTPAKTQYKIFRADDTHQLYTSFITLLKNFDREDLEDLWKIIKAGFSTSKPTNFTDDYLLVTLKNMFEKTDAQDVIWRSQQTEHGQALVKSWKLLTSCGVHIITFTTTMFVLLVEKKYPLSRFTLEQLVNVARLQVKEESEMSLELLRFTRQQLLEYQQE
nr:hypothetical protein [Tanacetum cinerariifolium]